VVGLLVNYGVFGFRDPWGIRPLVIGSRETATGQEYMLASESVALDVLGFTMLGDVAPGEAIFIDEHGHLHRRRCAPDAQLRPCIFEHVYFARPDSLMDGISIYKTRMRQGEALAKKIRRLRPELDIDVIIPIPTPAVLPRNPWRSS
jgi:amidophosphoribosyltransferase